MSKAPPPDAPGAQDAAPGDLPTARPYEKLSGAQYRKLRREREKLEAAAAIAAGDTDAAEEVPGDDEGEVPDLMDINDGPLWAMMLAVREARQAANDPTLPPAVRRREVAVFCRLIGSLWAVAPKSKGERGREVLAVATPEDIF